jgi:tetratricopeptide (TPR) repeat protein
MAVFQSEHGAQVTQMELNIDQALQRGVAAHREGKIQDAKRLYRAILQAQPSHPDANHNLGVLAVSVGKPLEAVPLFKLALEGNPQIEQFWLSYIDALLKAERLEEANQALADASRSGISSEKLGVFHEEMQHASPSQDQLNRLLGLYQSGSFTEAEEFALSLTQQVPNHPFGWTVLGAIYKQTGKLSASLSAKQKAVELSPQDAEAHNNLGNTLQELGRLDEAETSLKQAIALKPDYAEAHNNLGDTLQKLGRLDEAEASCKKAIALKPDYANAHNNLGNTLQDLGRLDEAEAGYIKAMQLEPDAKHPKINFVRLLSIHGSVREFGHPAVKANNEIRQIKMEGAVADTLPDNAVISLFHRFSDVINQHHLDLQTDDSQIFRRNSVNLGCGRHKAIFDQFNVIPEHCFGCYKVQVEPRSLIELMKVFVIFEQIKLPSNNIRKCMTEMRREFPGFYKGLIFCSEVEEAREIANSLDVIISQRIGVGLSATVKRGCSEFAVSYPAYKNVDKSAGQLMSFPGHWKVIEDEYDSTGAVIKATGKTVQGFNLMDALIIRNWIDYGRGVGDPSARRFDQTRVQTAKIYDIAKQRIEKYPYEIL